MYLKGRRINKERNKQTWPPFLPPNQYIPSSLDKHSALLRSLPNLTTLTTPDLPVVLKGVCPWIGFLIFYTFCSTGCISILQTMGAMQSGHLITSLNQRKTNGCIYLCTILVELCFQCDIYKSCYSVSKLKSPTPSFNSILPVPITNSFKWAYWHLCGQRWFERHRSLSIPFWVLLYSPPVATW
jgi:hypothetical protein